MQLHFRFINAVSIVRINAAYTAASNGVGAGERVKKGGKNKSRVKSKTHIKDNGRADELRPTNA